MVFVLVAIDHSKIYKVISSLSTLNCFRKKKMENSDNQLPIFGFKENLPSLKLKKIVSKERIAEMNKLYAKGDFRGTAEMLSDLNDKLERFDKRLKNKK